MVIMCRQLVDIDAPVPNSAIVEKSLYKFDKNSTMSIVTDVSTGYSMVAGDMRILEVSRPLLPAEC
jgi:hypothetical protein